MAALVQKKLAQSILPLQQNTGSDGQTSDYRILYAMHRPICCILIMQ